MFRGSPVGPRSTHQRTQLPLPKWTTFGPDGLWPCLALPGGASKLQSSDGYQLFPDKCAVLDKCREVSICILEQVCPVSRSPEGNLVFHRVLFMLTSVSKTVF